MRKKQCLIAGSLLLLILLAAACSSSPQPRVKLIRKVFEKGIRSTPPDYEEYLMRCAVLKDISYPSAYENARMDIILPLEAEDALPVIFWVHGGGYVGGDKDHVTEYAVLLASRGYVVVCINYQLAPEVQYPAPLIQTGEATRFFRENADYYSADINRIFLAGDSAGAQIAAQFVLIQTHPDYRDLTGFLPTVAPESIRGVLLFCGLFDFRRMIEGFDNSLYAYGLERIAWAYLGEKDWQNHPYTYSASVTPHAGPQFPPAFITDGNKDSFEEQGKALTEALILAGVPVDAVFYDRETWGNIFHEYQFLMDSQPARETFQRLLAFLERYAEVPELSVDTSRQKDYFFIDYFGAG